MKKWMMILCSVLVSQYVSAQSADSNRYYFKKLELKPLINSKSKDVPQTVKPDFYNQHLGFFCRQEWKVEKITHVPIRIRVGNPEHCNYLEQKTGYKLPVN